jgi:hypothetical protein
MATCVYCGARKGKRACPALGGEICPLCCGKHRTIDIECPSDCRWLQGLALVGDEPTGFTREQYAEACDRLLAFVDSAENRPYREDALSMLVPQEPGDEPISEAMVPVVQGFLAYGDRGVDGLRAIDRFVARSGRTLTSGQRAAIAALEQAWASLFEVEAVQMGSGLTLRDLVGGERIELREVSASAHLVRGDTIFAWVMTAGDHLELTGAAMTIPPRFRDPLLDTIREELELIRDERPDASARALVGELADLVIVELHELMRAAGRPKLVTTHGEDLVFCEAHYEVKDPVRVRAKLARQPTFEREGAGSETYVWLDRRPNKQLGGGPTVLGRIRCGEARLVLETHSRERLERGRALLEQLAGTAIAHQADTFADPASKLREGGRPARSAPPEIPEEVQAEVIGQVLRDHYRRWLREPVPALGGKTPLAAARSKAGREHVARLIEEAERSSARMPGGDDPELWDELRVALKIEPRARAGRGLVYDADEAPDPARWRAADEDVRIAAVRAYHDALASHPPAPNPKLHALFHAIVENQLAAGDPPEVAQTLERLLAGGASRHGAIHALASVVAEEVFAVMKEQRVYDRKATSAALARLRPGDWTWE